MGRFLEFKPYSEDRFQTNLKLLVFVGTDQERISLMVYRYKLVGSLLVNTIGIFQIFPTKLKSWWLVGWLVIRLLPYLGWRGPAIAAPHPPTLLQE